MSNRTKLAITDMESLCRKSIDLIHYARNLAVQQINLIELMTNYALGRWIVEEQQNGQDRAQYGARLINKLAEALTAEFGRGYSRETIKNCRRFYLEYKDRIGQTLFSLFAVEKSQTVFAQLKKQPPSVLSWSHYLILMRIENENERQFYETESAKSQWSVRTLQRQYASSLYERLLLSSEKDKAMELSQQGVIVERPQDLLLSNARSALLLTKTTSGSISSCIIACSAALCCLI